MEGILKNSYSKVIKKKISYDNLATFLNDVLALLSQILLYIIGSYFISKSYITVGEAVKFFGLSYIVKDLINVISIFLRKYYEFDVSADRIYEFTSNEELLGDYKLNNIESIDVKALSFKYEDKEILNNVNLLINKGDKVVIKGSNGSGKSTLIKLLAALYTNYEGNILINGAQQREIDILSLREQMTLISQNQFILNKSVYDNIKIYCEDSDEESIDKFLKSFNIYDIKDKVAGDNGAMLSGGQKQKIAIIRALLRKGELLILDEPCNYLDKESVKQLKDELENDKRTMLIISHNDELLSLADNIYKVSEGRVVREVSIA